MGLMYLSRHSRPDLAQAINGLPRRLTAWTRADDRALIRLYEFLRTKADHVLLIRDAAGVEGVHARWTPFTDSDFAGVERVVVQLALCPASCTPAGRLPRWNGVA